MKWYEVISCQNSIFVEPDSHVFILIAAIMDNILLVTATLLSVLCWHKLFLICE